MSRIVITETKPAFVTRALTEEFFDTARNWCADCEKYSFEFIKHIDLYTDSWGIDEYFLIVITFNKWQRAKKGGKLLSFILGLNEETQDIDVYREGKKLFLRRLLL